MAALLAAAGCGAPAPEPEPATCREFVERLQSRGMKVRWLPSWDGAVVVYRAGDYYSDDSVREAVRGTLANNAKAKAGVPSAETPGVATAA